MKRLEPCRMLWQKNKDGQATLLRFYGTSSQVYLPPQIAGYSLTEIAPYCFAAKQRRPDSEVRETILGEQEETLYLQELHTNAIEEVWLPDSVTKIGSCAFYNCKKLHTLCIGADLRNIGSDAFMNTLSFRRVILRCEAGKPSGVRQILAQVSSDMEVCFLPDKNPQAVLLYPEYYESYDEIAPAHLFGRSISGEGFRARQCIKDGKVDFDGYDAVFLQACVEEREETLAQMAQNRLRYPYALNEKNKRIYREYVKAHILGIARRLIRQRDLGQLRFLQEEKLLLGTALTECAKEASESEWPEGAVTLLGWLAAEKKDKKKGYDFDF